jgi:tRNA-dihydrouridine synthase A
MHAYALHALKDGFSLRNIARHMLGLYHGERKARLWRRMLSDSTALARNDPGLLLAAMEAAESRSMMAA